MARGANMKALSEGDLSLLLTMVDRSGRELAPDEHESVFADYAAIALATGTVPGLDTDGRDDSAAGMLDVDIYLGIGLALLGQIGVKVLNTLTDMAVQRGAHSTVDLVGRLFRRRRTPAGPDPMTPEAQAVV